MRRRQEQPSARRYRAAHSESLLLVPGDCRGTISVMPMSAEIREILMQREPGAAIVQALDALLEHDEHLFRVDANERSLTHRFGMYLQVALPNWDVDCEYNRNGPDPKRIVLGERLVDIVDTDGKTAYPDVIAHVRDTDRNYLVLEFKKTSNRAGDHDDFAKLDAYKHDPRLRYAFAIFIELQVGERPGVSRAVWFD
jgi:hypothetical protein